MEPKAKRTIKLEKNMFGLLRKYMKKNPDQKLLKKSIVKKAFLRSKRGRRELCLSRLAKLKKSKFD